MKTMLVLTILILMVFDDLIQSSSQSLLFPCTKKKSVEVVNGKSSQKTRSTISVTPRFDERYVSSDWHFKKYNSFHEKNNITPLTPSLKEKNTLRTIRSIRESWATSKLATTSVKPADNSSEMNPQKLKEMFGKMSITGRDGTVERLRPVYTRSKNTYQPPSQSESSGDETENPYENRNYVRDDRREPSNPTPRMRLRLEGGASLPANEIRIAEHRRKIVREKKPPERSELSVPEMLRRIEGKDKLKVTDLSDSRSFRRARIVLNSKSEKFDPYESESSS